MVTNDAPALPEALRLIGCGYRVVPLHTPTDGGACDCRRPGCSTPGKHPRTVRGATDGSNDVGTVQKWFAMWPAANLGVVLGDDVILVDIDGQDALERLRELVGDQELLPRSPTVVTGRPGWHVYYQSPGRVRSFDPVEGVNVKTGNGIAVVPPSMHRSGATYEYAADRTLGELELAPCPPWLLAMLQGQGRREARKPGEPIPDGRRHDTLLKIAGAMRRQGAAQAEIRAALAEANRRCQPPVSERDLDVLAGSVAGYPPDPDPVLGLGKRTVGTARRLLSVRASEVKPESVAWLWADRVPLGKLSIIEGDPGLAKSTITLDLIARVTRGGRMPDGSPGIGPSSAIVASVEDGAADTIVPRLMAAGADLQLVDIITGAGREDDPGLMALPTDAGLLEARIVELGARLVVVDPLAAFFDDRIDSHNDHHARRGLGPLAGLADRTGAAVVVIRHLTKGVGGSPIYRGTGSIGIFGAARSVMLVAVNPDAENERVLVVSKHNLAADSPALRYEVHSHRVGMAVEASRIAWLGESRHTARELLMAVPGGGDADDGALGEAEAFLVEALGSGPQPAVEIIKQAGRVAIAKRTLYRAKGTLRVRSAKSRGADHGAWEWSLDPTSPRADLGDVGAVADRGQS